MQPLHAPISMSIFDLFKAGPGPSSSHTIGPMRAGVDFVRQLATLDPDLLARAQGVRVCLLGSLSATGKGHGTDIAVLAGLMGNEPESCPPSLLRDIPRLPPEERVLRAGGLVLPLGPGNIVFGPVQHSCPYSNTLIIELLSIPFPSDLPYENENSKPEATLFVSPLHEGGCETVSGPDSLAGSVLFSREYYSVGGGFLQWQGWQAEERGRPAHPYVNTRQLLVRLAESGLTLDALLMENEMSITGASAASINEGLDRILETMRDSVRRGIATGGPLPGALGLMRKAPVLYERSASLQPFDRQLCCLNAYAYAAAEENAAGNVIVTAPTCGAAGVMPALVMFLQEHLGLSAPALRKGLLAAAAVGLITKQNAGIAGAEVGCQGEVGTASAMAAAMLSEARGYSARVVENAAEIALEHHLGLTCDPVGGYVQIPCIERNAVGACKAYNAALIACNENPASHMVRYDDVLLAMAEIGKDMSSKYKETSTGGLAACLVFC